MKEYFENRPTFVEVMNECVVAQFFWTLCVHTGNVSSLYLRPGFPEHAWCVFGQFLWDVFL